MKKKFIIFLLFTILPCVLLNAAENKDNETPDASIGVNGNFGTFDINKNNVHLETEPGLYTGGGLTIEKMIYPVFGFGSGIQYRYFKTDFVMKDKNKQEVDATWTFKTINIPFLMILSFSGGDSSLNLVGGAVYSHIFHSEMKADEDEDVTKHKDNVLKFTNTNQIGATAGIIFKIRATKFSDFMFGVMGEYYPTSIIYNRNGSDDKINMLNYSLMTGYMFRTNIFPGSEKKNNL